MPKHAKLLRLWPETQGGWIKSSFNPVLGGDLGTCFDISVLKEIIEGKVKFRMWMSWRPKESIALVESSDGVHWSFPIICLSPQTSGLINSWEQRINRPCVIFHDNVYHMWYTGQSEKFSSIGYATSDNGVQWSRKSASPVLASTLRWEKKSVMCPHVLWDSNTGLFQMWYSAGGQYEPKSIGYATSRDGYKWEKLLKPVFQSNKKEIWENDRVAAVQVLQNDGYYYMFYVGFADINHARIGLARSKDGINDWERHPMNPLICPGMDQWDHDACYKPYAILDETTKSWNLWYNGRHGSLEQIGLATHQGENLWD